MSLKQHYYNPIVESLKKSILIKSFSLLPKSDRKKLLLVTILQTSLGLLDLIAVVLIGALGALTVSGVQSKSAGDRVSSMLELMHLQNLNFQTQVAVLGLFATGLFLLRTILSVVITKRVLRFLGGQSARITSNTFRLLLSDRLLNIQKRSTQELLYALTVGVDTISMGILATGVALIADTSLALILGLGLFILDPVVAVIALLIFGLIGLYMYSQLHAKARELGEIQTDLNISSSEEILEALETFRETFVRNRRHYYAKNVAELRFALSSVSAELKFMPNLSKYVIETAVIVGALLVSAIQFIRLDANHAIATMTVFMAAGARIAPAVLRLQQGSILIKSSLGSAHTTLDLIEELKSNRNQFSEPSFFSGTHNGFNSTVSIKNLSLRYPGSSYDVLSEISLEIPQGAFIALVGESGAGKSTLVDVILGLINPDSGSVCISDHAPELAINKWPGSIAYVPQDIKLIDGSIEKNVALGFAKNEYEIDSVWGALKIAQLDDFVSAMPFGLQTQVGESGSKLSGGQKQRLGIARAVFTKPKLIVMDEATSALDGITESSVSDAIQNLKGDVTLILVAHRLSTVRNADCVVYMKKGKIEAQGSFTEIRNLVPDFEVQAKLMGL